MYDVENLKSDYYSLLALQKSGRVKRPKEKKLLKEWIRRIQETLATIV